MIYTIVPQDVLYEGMDQLKHPEELMISGMLMQVERIDATRVRMIRLLTTEPSAYLNPALCPGQIIDLSSAAQTT